MLTGLDVSRELVWSQFLPAAALPAPDVTVVIGSGFIPWCKHQLAMQFIVIYYISSFQFKEIVI